MEKQMKIRRFIPCSLYCTAKIESWLEEMASEGYIFYTFSQFDYAVFIKEKPQKIYYRLCLKGNNKHESGIRKFMQKYGWQSVDEIKNLVLFSSQDPKPFEADGNCELTELQNKAIKYRSKQNIVNSASPLLIIAMYIFFEEIAINAVNFGIVALLMPISMILFFIARHIIEILDIRTYKKHINDKNAYIKNTSKINLVLYITKYISMAAILISLILVFASSEKNSDIIYYNSDGKENPPFATVEDFAPENAALKSESDNDPSAMFNKWSNIASSVNYYWREDESYIHSDGTTERIQLNVDYHETISPLLAKWLIWDYYFKDKSLKIKPDVIELSGYDIDYGLTYRNWGYLVVIAQKDNKLIKAEFESIRQTEEEPFKAIDNITDEEAIEIICNNF